MKKMTKSYFISGMHCPACSKIIAETLNDHEVVKKAEVKHNPDRVEILFKDKELSENDLNRLFKDSPYRFSTTQNNRINWWLAFGLLIGVFVIYFLISKLQLDKYFNIEGSTSLGLFAGLGLIAGVSTCAALIGGIVISLGQQWKNDKSPIWPHLQFNFGRIGGFFLLGTILGLIGKNLTLSQSFFPWLIIIISIWMLIIGLRLAGVKIKKLFHGGNLFEKFKHKIDHPVLIGVATFFLPCGFALTAQGASLIAASPLHSGLIMASFALGSTIPLLIIGYFSTKLWQPNKYQKTLTLAAGLLIIIFALFNLRNQINLIFPQTVFSNNQPTIDSTLTNQNTQTIYMDASASGYSPNSFTVKAGIPVRWEITDTGTSGCTNRLVAKSLFSETLALQRGKTIVKEFTATKTGTYSFSCWMGMVTGKISVVK